MTVYDTPEGVAVFNFYDYERKPSVLWLSAIFIVAVLVLVLVLGRWRDAGAIAGLVASVLVIVVFLIPAILGGPNAIMVALVGAVFIAVVALFVAHGANVATAVALLSSFASMAITVALADAFVRIGNPTGFSDEDTQFLSALAVPIDPRGLLLAGVLIGSLGVLDDVIEGVFVELAPTCSVDRWEPSTGHRHGRGEDQGDDRRVQRCRETSGSFVVEHFAKSPFIAFAEVAREFREHGTAIVRRRQDIVDPSRGELRLVDECPLGECPTGRQAFDEALVVEVVSSWFPDPAG